MTFFFFTFKVLQIARCDDDLVQPTVSLTTQNVYGFADFTTTIGNTVMIFSPSSIAANPGDFSLLSVDHSTRESAQSHSNGLKLHFDYYFSLSSHRSRTAD